MNVSDFDFSLPEHLIAQHPPAERGQSRLMVLLKEGTIEHTTFGNLHQYLVPGDVLVVNNTEVFSARLLGRRVPSGGRVECLLLRQLSTVDDGDTPESVSSWSALVHPGQKLKPGERMRFEQGDVQIDGEVLAMHFHGRRTLRLSTTHPGGLARAIDMIGHVPLPPYIKRPDAPIDRERYQTVYATERGSIAAPTAGLHFTTDQLRELSVRGVERVDLTLHVGYGTFKPVTVDRVEAHAIDAERFTVSESAAAQLTRAKRERRRIIAVGTTSVRTLESLAVEANGTVGSADGETSLFIRPGHRFRLVRGIVTNFHLPRSSLLMLVCAFGGTDRVLGAYREAVTRGYRFYSYGDAMLIL